MSLLHRNVLSQILAAIDPLIEVGAAVVNPLAGAGARLVLTDVEHIVDGTAAAAAPVSVLPPDHVSPVPPPADLQASLSGQRSSIVSAPAPAAPPPPPLSAQDVIAALMQTLQALSARAK